GGRGQLGQDGQWSGVRRHGKAGGRTRLGGRGPHGVGGVRDARRERGAPDARLVHRLRPGRSPGHRAGRLRRERDRSGRRREDRPAGLRLLPEGDDRPLMDTRVIRYFDLSLFASMVLLVAFGLAMVYSATYETQGAGINPLVYRQAAYAVIGLILFVALSGLDYHVLSNLAWPAYLGCCGLLGV